MRLFKPATLLIVFIALLGLASLPAEAVIVINELLANPGSFDANEDGIADTIQDEFVELFNVGSASVSLEGWRLTDAITTRHVFSPGDTIFGSGFLTVFGLNASSGRLGLNNSSDTITLWNADGTAVDAFSYSSSQAGVSWSRNPDGVGDFTAHPGENLPRFSPTTTLAQIEEESPAEPIEEPVFDQPDFGSPPNHPGTNAVPEPASAALFGPGLVWLFGRRRKK